MIMQRTIFRIHKLLSKDIFTKKKVKISIKPEVLYCYNFQMSFVIKETQFFIILI